MKKLSARLSNIILGGLFFSSLLLSVWAVNIYRLTIIHFEYLIVGGILTTGFLLLISSRFFTILFHKFWWFFQSLITGIGFFSFVILIMNKTFATPETTLLQLKIDKRGTLATSRYGCGKPYIVVDFDGVEKQLVFACGDADIVQKSSEIEIEYSQGFFYFPVIKRWDFR